MILTGRLPVLLQFKSILFRKGQERMFYILRITAAKVTLHLKKDWIKNLNNNFPPTCRFLTLFLVFNM